MDMNSIIKMASRMFPSANVQGAIQQAQQAISGTPDTLEGVSAAAKKLGIDKSFIDGVFSRYGNSAQAKMLCNMLGTTPQALKSDADKLFGGSVNLTKTAPITPTTSKFPRLK